MRTKEVLWILVEMAWYRPTIHRFKRLYRALVEYTPDEWRNSKQYRTWRRNVLNRDHNTCQDCGKDGTHAHHIERAAENPDRRFDVDNGVTLCSTCHANRHEAAGEKSEAAMLRASSN